MQYDSSNHETSKSSEIERERMRADPSVADTLVSRWREAEPAEHGRVLWGLLEFADYVRNGRTTEIAVEPLGSLPVPIAERRTGPPG